MKLIDFAQFLPVHVFCEGTAWIKHPVNRKGERCDAHDPANWMPFAEAHALAAANKWEIGFVLTAHDPFFCIDIDHCLLPGGKQWSPLAVELMRRMNGARMERSISDTGIHIWGSYRTIPPHKCKNTKLGLELYHEKRFIVLGHNPVGDESTDMTALLPEIINLWFKPAMFDSANGSPEWTDEPCPEWSGPIDDDELIDRALTSVSARAAFGATVTFRDLWECNVEKLASVWPHETNAYDASSADMSLAQRLAYWTGRDCERIKTLMLRSGLVREKYDRPDYLTRTILTACSDQHTVYSAVSAAEVERAAERGGWVTAAEMAAHFHGCVYIEDRDRILTPDGRLLDSRRFDARYGGSTYVLDERKSERSAWKAFTQHPAWKHPFAHSMCFRPDLPPSTIIDDQGILRVNTYQPAQVVRKKGDCSRFVELTNKLLPNDDDAEILRSYMAACVQYPGVKFSWCPILQGVEGNGKTFLCDALRYAVGHNYSFVVDTDRIAGNGARFNEWIDRRLLIIIEEIFINGNRAAIERLKPLITNNDIALEGKGISVEMTTNFANFMLTTNHLDAMPVTEDSRRYAPLVTNQQKKADLERDGLGPDFLIPLWNWARDGGGWAIIADYLATYPVKQEYNPATECKTAPPTSGRAVVMESTRTEEEELVVEAIESGQPGFCGGWVSSAMMDRLLATRPHLARLNHNRKATILRRLGYDHHPALVKGRSPRTVTPDGVRPALWVKLNHPACSLSDANAVAAAYEKAQTGTFASPVGASVYTVPSP